MFKKKTKAETAQEAAKSPLDEWEEDMAAETAKKKEKKKEKKEKKEKVPLTPAQKKKRKKRIIIAGITAAVLAVFVLPGLLTPPALPQVNVTEAAVGTVEQTISGSGTVKSEEVKTYFSPVSAMVADFDLQVGDTVEAGETLLTYDAKQLEELYKQAELTGSAASYGYQDAVSKNNENVAEYNRSTAELDRISKDLDEEEDEFDHVTKRISEYTGYKNESGARLDELKAQRETAKAAGANLEAAQKELEKAKEELAVWESNKPSEENADYEAKLAELQNNCIIAEGKVTAAKAEADKAQAALPELEKKIQEVSEEYIGYKEKLEGYEKRLSDAQENITELQGDKAKEEGIQSSSDASILSSSAKAELSANNKLSTLNAQMTKDDINEAKNGIQADFSGVVTEVAAVPGGPAAQGGNLFTVASNEKVIVDMSVTRFDLEKLEVGQSAEITVAGKSYTGTLSKLSRLAKNNEKGTPVVSAEIHIENPDENIYLGLEAKVTVSGNKAEDVIAVPVEAVNVGQDGEFCYVVEKNTVVKKPVETGLSSDTMVEIKSGLAFGDKVIRGGAPVEEGMTVNAVEG